MLYDKYAKKDESGKDVWNEHATTPTSAATQSPSSSTKAWWKTLNWCWVVTLGILILVFLGSSISGSILLAQGSNKKKSLAKVDPTVVFEYLGDEACTITEVDLNSYTVKRSESCGNKCTKNYHICVDEMSYAFTIGEDSVEYKSRIQSSERNRKDSNSYSDRCNGSGLDPYDGTYLDKNLPFVCEGGICEEGDTVKCWQPTETCSDAGCNEDLRWADCGNKECKKLVDPTFEYDDAVSDAQGLYIAGIVLLPIAAASCIIAAVLKFCCQCSMQKN